MSAAAKNTGEGMCNYGTCSNSIATSRLPGFVNSKHETLSISELVYAVSPASINHDFSSYLLDGVQKSVRIKVCPKHIYHKMACNMVYSKGLLAPKVPYLLGTRW